MDHLLTCACGMEHTVSRSQADQEIQCECGNSIRIPTLRGLSQLPLANHTRSEKPTSTVWGGWRGPGIAICSAVFFISAGLFSLFGLQSFFVVTSNNLESEIAAGDDTLDQYGPDALSMVWHDSDTFGMGVKARPGFYLWEQHARDRARLATIAGIIAAVFGVMGLGILISAFGKG